MFTPDPVLIQGQRNSVKINTFENKNELTSTLSQQKKIQRVRFGENFDKIINEKIQSSPAIKVGESGQNHLDGALESTFNCESPIEKEISDVVMIQNDKIVNSNILSENYLIESESEITQKKHERCVRILNMLERILVGKTEIWRLSGLLLTEFEKDGETVQYRLRCDHLKRKISRYKKKLMAFEHLKVRAETEVASQIVACIEEKEGSLTLITEQKEQNETVIITAAINNNNRETNINIQQQLTETQPVAVLAVTPIVCHVDEVFSQNINNNQEDKNNRKKNMKIIRLVFIINKHKYKDSEYAEEFEELSEVMSHRESSVEQQTYVAIVLWSYVLAGVR